MPQPDGTIFSRAQFAADGWSRYLDVFDELVVLGREAQLKQGEDKTKLNISSRDRVTFWLVADSNNLKGFVTQHRGVRPDIEEAVADCDALILRGVSEFGWMAFQSAQRLGKPIAMEVVADAFDDLWHHGSAAAKALAPIRLKRARAMTGGASHLIYVTEKTLQKRYPPNPSAVSVEHASNVEIADPDPQILAARLERIAVMAKGEAIKVGVIGSLEHRLKGIDIAVQACAALPPSVKLQVVGPGDPAPYKAMPGGARVDFMGLMPSGMHVDGWLRTLDLYIQPSRQEGLPRAIIEAMAMALPVIASDVGGIPELLDPQSIVPRDDTAALARAVSKLLSDPTTMIAQARRNFDHAKEYGVSKLKGRRDNFWAGFGDYVRRGART